MTKSLPFPGLFPEFSANYQIGPFSRLVKNSHPMTKSAPCPGLCPEFSANDQIGPFSRLIKEFSPNDQIAPFSRFISRILTQWPNHSLFQVD